MNTLSQIRYLGRFCFTIPVSFTGSLWSGFGGFRYRACSFTLRQVVSRQLRVIRTACYAYQPGAEYQAQATPSARIRRPRLVRWHWDRIDDCGSHHLAA